MFFKKSPWIIHYDGSSCNGCDIEVLACLTPVYDAERLGIMNTGNPKHADILLITGSVNEQNKEVIQNIYYQMPDPKVVVGVGICACSGGIFADCYNVLGGVDKVIPVDIYVPGCAARPEAIFDGVLQAVEALEAKYTMLRRMHKGLEELTISTADVYDAEEILTLQRVAYQSEAEIYNDFSLTPLRQTLQEMREDFKDKIFFKATMHGQIIGSVRGYQKDECCHIGRLIVYPMYQNLGIGKKLMHAIEKHFAQSKEYEIFTGHKSKRNIYFYQKLGYRIVRTEKVSEKRSRVFLQKVNV